MMLVWPSVGVSLAIVLFSIILIQLLRQVFQAVWQRLDQLVVSALEEQPEERLSKRPEPGSQFSLDEAEQMLLEPAHHLF
jgi:hypothetical protein